MAGGGDFSPNCSGRVTTGEIVDEVKADYSEAKSTISAEIQGGVKCAGTGCPVVRP